MEKGLTKYLIIFICVLFSLSSIRCSVYMAAKQPEKKNIDLFRIGTPRSMLLAEFGLPVVSEVREDGKKYEIYTFTHGYSGASRTGRAVFHGAADVITLGLWEVVGTPVEGAFDGTEMAYEVRYDENDKIDQVILLKKK